MWTKKTSPESFPAKPVEDKVLILDIAIIDIIC